MGILRTSTIIPAPARLDVSRRSDFVGQIQSWSARLRDHQRCIRVLDAVRWNGIIEEHFFAAGARELPAVTVDHYRQAVPLERVRARLVDLRQIEREIASHLGRGHAAGRLLLRRCRSAQEALKLIAARGTREFVWLSREIFGSTLGNRVTHERLARLVQWLECAPLSNHVKPTMDAAAAASELHRRLNEHFAPATIRVDISDALSADACAGAGYLKVRRDARFTWTDIDLLEAHEGWAHVGTMLSGLGQPIFNVLAGSVPCVTGTQEGIAVFTEILADACTPERRHRLANRLQAVMMAERGADFLDVYQHFLDRGHDERNAYRNSVRVYRGSLPGAYGPFTKDYSYGLGLIDLTNCLRTQRDDEGQLIPLLFSGKTCLEDLPDLAELHADGLLIAGEYVPPVFDRDNLRRALREMPGW